MCGQLPLTVMIVADDKQILQASQTISQHICSPAKQSHSIDSAFSHLAPISSHAPRLASISANII
jgi:hypothetical protein